MGKLVAIISFVICLAAFVFLSVAYSVPYWLEYEAPVTNVKLVFGLFQYCIKDDSADTCDNMFGGDMSWQHIATLVTIGIALVVNIAALVCLGKAMCGKKSMIKVGAGLSALIGCLSLSGVVMYSTQLTSDDGIEEQVKFFGWAYWIAAVSSAAHIANCIVTFILDCISCC